MSANIVLELKGLKKKYSQKEAVKGINLSIPAGELFVLLGKNGAGKTTTLKMAVGLLKPTEGNVLIGGFDMVKQSKEAKSWISFVPDVPYVYDKLTPKELLRFIGKLYGMNPRQVADKGKELLHFFSLDDVADVLIESFSHGMKQKVILSAALLHNPKVLILDEPMVGLDPISIKSFKDFLKTKAREGMAIIFSTHTLSLAEEMADRIGIINHGELISLGTLSELKEKYQSKENLEHMFMKLVEEPKI